jgi:hypothetical protein
LKQTLTLMYKISGGKKVNQEDMMDFADAIGEAHIDGSRADNEP